MTTMTIGSPAALVSARRGRRAELVGLGVLIRLNLRRERIPLLIWILGVSAVAASTFSAIASLYPDEAERAALAASITANPAFLAMLGPVNSTSVGGLTAWRIGVIAATMIALMAIFTVTRRTRADEEAGRTELLMAGVVGRSAQLVAAVLTAMGAALIIGVVVTAAGIAQGTPVTGSVALGAAFAGCGWAFAGSPRSPRNWPRTRARPPRWLAPCSVSGTRSGRWGTPSPDGPGCSGSARRAG